MGCTIIRGAGVVNGRDGLTSGGILEFIGTSYDSTKLRRFGGVIKEWNGSSFVEAPIINNWASGDAIVQSIVEDSTINFGSFTNCTINNSIIKNTTVTFTANSQTVEGQVWVNDVLISPPPFRTVNYGASITLTRPTNVLVGKTGTGPVDVFLPTANLAVNNIVIVSDYGANCSAGNNITVQAGGGDLILSYLQQPIHIMTSDGESRVFRLVDNTPGAYVWKMENYD
jgi:hypothetical protein